MQSLRFRLLISHSLPLLLIIFLTGFALDYLVETQIILPGLAEELSNEAKLFSELAASRSDSWDDPGKAEEYLTDLEPLLAAYVTLFDSQGVFLASTDPSFQNSSNPAAARFDLNQSVDAIIQTTYGVDQDASVVDVYVPVHNGSNTFLGGIQMSYHLESVYNQLLVLRRGIIGILTLGVLLGSVMALLLSADLNRALLRVKTSIEKLATGKEIGIIEEDGPEEIRGLMRTLNKFISRVNILETSRRKLLSNLVHELGRPLGALLLAVQALRAGAAQNEDLRQELFTGMEDEINILRRLLDDLTGLYDQMEGTFVLDKREVNLNEMLPGLVRSQKETALIKGISWRTDIQANLPWINIDSDRITQAVGNLAENAIKFTPSWGTITYSAGVQAQEVWIRIQDTGSGIPAEDQILVFTPFFQSRSETRFPQGMGLGLSIAHDLVTAHQGRIEFESTPGKGTSFTIWLPINLPDKNH